MVETIWTCTRTAKSIARTSLVCEVWGGGGGVSPRYIDKRFCPQYKSVTRKKFHAQLQFVYIQWRRKTFPDGGAPGYTELNFPALN